MGIERNNPVYDIEEASLSAVLCAVADLSDKFIHEFWRWDHTRITPAENTITVFRNETIHSIPDKLWHNDQGGGKPPAAAQSSRNLEYCIGFGVDLLGVQQDDRSEVNGEGAEGFQEILRLFGLHRAKTKFVPSVVPDDKLNEPVT